MHDHDGIMTLLQIPDPAEKRLALRSKQVQPYHLRHALQDSDPSVRLVAAQHPHLTPELMTEILRSDDKDLRSAVIKRADIPEHLLEEVAIHPDHALEVAGHPRCTDAIREMALRHHAVPESVKLHHRGALKKNIGYVLYPQLGEAKVYTKPMHLTSTQSKTRVKYSGSPNELSQNTGGWLSHNAEDRKGARPDLTNLTSVVTTMDRPGSKETQAKFPKDNPVDQFVQAKDIDTGKTIHANEGHEAQHSVFARLGQKYGTEAKLRVVATTLSRLSPAHRQHISRLYRGGGLEEGPTVDPEETIAYLHNYLQDPHRRKFIHQRMGLIDTTRQNESVNLARKAWNELRSIGLSLRPEDVGVEPQNYQDQVSKWLKSLGKRESMPTDQLGFSVSFLEIIAICEFLTQRTADQPSVRQSIREHGDGLVGILAAFGLNTPEGRKAFDSVKTLKLHKTEDFLKTPKLVQCLDDPDFSEVVDAMYENKAITPISLNGKHSSGTYIGKDAEGHNWLLKPGSGKKSPAAGVDETKGSQSRREVVFAAIGQWLGIPEVQPAHLLNVDGKEVAALRMWPMDWVNLHRSMYEEPNLPTTALEPYRRRGETFKWAVLDYITGNPDRHGNNLMVGPAVEGNKIGLIDHGSAMAGAGFDPGNDKDSFVPYYLRAWSGPNFHTLPREEQYRQMPLVHGPVDDELREWVMAIDPSELERIVYELGMDPTYCLARLHELQSDPMVESFSGHIARLWLESPED